MGSILRFYSLDCADRCADTVASKFGFHTCKVDSLNYLVFVEVVDGGNISLFGAS